MVFIWNLPNVLTLFRVVCVPVCLFLLWVGRGSDSLFLLWLAFGVFVVAIFTDRLDGYFARRGGQVTDFGKIADPIADKLLIGSILLFLGFVGEVSWWLLVPILLREVSVTVLRFVVLGRLVVAASAGGKVKTVLQTVAVGLYIFPGFFWGSDLLAFWVFLGAFFVTLFTGFRYFFEVFRVSFRGVV